jgi:hypothetical protein
VDTPCRDLDGFDVCFFPCSTFWHSPVARERSENIEFIAFPEATQVAAHSVDGMGYKLLGMHFLPRIYWGFRDDISFILRDSGPVYCNFCFSTCSLC